MGRNPSGLPVLQEQKRTVGANKSNNPKGLNCIHLIGFIRLRWQKKSLSQRYDRDSRVRTAGCHV